MHIAGIQVLFRCYRHVVKCIGYLSDIVAEGIKYWEGYVACFA
jgi:hypothetical protein